MRILPTHPHLPAFGLAAVVAVSLGLSGCAKYPDSAGPSTGTRITVRFRTDGPIRTGLEPGSPGLPYVYIVALRLSEDVSPTTDGPLPVVTPGGNGFVAGNATHYILWNPLGSPQYQIYQFRDATLNEWTLTGTPVDTIPVEVGNQEIGFSVDMSQLVPLADLNRYRSVQINLLTMNNTNPSGTGRLWDALGDGRIPSQTNRFLTLRLDADRVYSNISEGNLEPVGDQADPSLDIADVTVAIRPE